MRRIRWALFLSALILVPYLAYPELSTLRFRSHVPEGSLPVPLIPQSNGFTCGAASLLSVLLYWNADDDAQEIDLVTEMRTNASHGTRPSRIIEAARARGLNAELRENQNLANLREALDRGETWIIMLQAWSEQPDEDEDPLPPWSERWNDGHYAVLVGMASNRLYFMDPSLPGRYGYITQSEFLDRWHDYDYEGETSTQREYLHAAVRIRGQNPRNEFPENVNRIY